MSNHNSVNTASQAKKTQFKLCLKCGTVFHRRRYGKRLEDYSRWKTRKYCSKSCNYVRESIQHETSFHREARKHLKNQCENCEGTKKLEAHHMDRNIKNNSPKNIQTLCRSCHMKLHWDNGDIKPNFKNLKRGTKKIGQKPKLLNPRGVKYKN